MRRFLIATTATLALAGTGTAIAADAVELPPEPPAAALSIAPTDNWSGFYAGAFGGYTWGTFDSAAGDIDADGFNGGAFVGFNHQIGTVVYGLEGDVGFSGVDGTLTGTTVTADQGAFGSLRARMGYAFDPVLIYGTGGLAVTQAEVTNGVNTDENTHIGWTIGAGVDAAVTENIFGRLEYRYSDYASEDFVLGGTTVSSGFSDHSVRAGIGLKF